VLLKGISAGGFVFFTDFRSHKGRDLSANPHAALVFHWQPLERQVRVAGSVEQLDEASAYAYFQSRPEGSRLGAWASEQSSELADRAWLERRVAELSREFAGREIPLPPHWGGYRVLPSEIEFWQGRPDRLHDRLVYTRTPELGWRLARLSP
jgi:pyridoxamine 5'-phosphate oxidase